MLPDGVVQMLSLSGLKERIADIDTLALESIRFLPKDVKDLPIGSSRLGGMPDLPPNFSWPVWKGNPMSFIAQIRLEDIATFPEAALLSKNGLLSFFYDSRQETYGADPADRGGWQVVYFAPAQGSLSQTPFPDGLAEDARFSALPVTFTRELTLPSSPSQYRPDLKWPEDDVSKYEQFLADFPSTQDRAAPRHRMSGYADQIQDDMQIQCAWYANGITDMDDPRTAEAERTKSEWSLLLQVDSDDRTGMQWASAGMIYFWIRQSDLAAQRFENTWLVLQSD